MIRQSRLYLPALLCGMALLPRLVLGQEVTLPKLPTELADAITFHAASGVLYDSNLFRDVDGEQRSDIITTFEAGANMDLLLSRQRLLLDLNINRNVFDEFDTLNYTGGDANAELQWELGRRWTGDLGFIYDRTLSGFTERSVDPDNPFADLKDIRTRKRGFVSANYELTPRWQLRAGVESEELEQDIRTLLNRDRDAIRTGVRYTSRARNFVDLEGEFTDTTFPIPQISQGVTIDNDFQQSEIRTAVRYSFSDSVVNGRIGYLSREHEDNSDRDFNGVVGRLNYIWQVSAKTRLDVTARREITSFTDVLGEDDIADDVVASFILIQGVSINPSYALTSKLDLQGRLSYEQRNFRGDPLADADDPEREDDVLFTGVTLNYLARRNIQASLSFEHEDRNSSLADNSFEVDLIAAALRVDF